MMEPPIITAPTTSNRASIREVGAAVVSAMAYQVLIASFTNLTWVVDGKAYCCSGEVYWENPLASRLSAAVWLYAARAVTQLPPRK